MAALGPLDLAMVVDQAQLPVSVILVNFGRGRGLVFNYNHRVSQSLS